MGYRSSSLPEDPIVRVVLSDVDKSITLATEKVLAWDLNHWNGEAQNPRLTWTIVLEKTNQPFKWCLEQDDDSITVCEAAHNNIHTLKDMHFQSDQKWSVKMHYGFYLALTRVQMWFMATCVQIFWEPYTMHKYYEWMKPSCAAYYEQAGMQANEHIWLFLQWNMIEDTLGILYTLFYMDLH